MRRTFLIFLGIATALIVASPALVRADDLPINYNLPGLDPLAIRAEGPVALVGGFYTFAFTIAGFLAFIMIVYAGVRYALSAGNHSAQSDAKDAIQQALLGLALLLLAYLILRTINPDLTTLRMPNLPAYVAPTPPTPPVGIYTCGQPGDGTCPAGGVCRNASTDPNAPLWICATTPAGQCPAAQPLSPLPPFVQSLEANGNRVLFTAPHAGIQSNLTKLQAEIAKLRQAITAAKPGATITINSAYRPLDYQKHLWEVCDRYKKLKDNATPECSALKLQVTSEFSRHGIAGGVNCVVAQPTGSAPHTKGIGLDITINGLTPAANDREAEATAAQAIITANGHIDLKYRAINNDPVHFELQNPPYTGPGQ